MNKNRTRSKINRDHGPLNLSYYGRICGCTKKMVHRIHESDG